MKPRILFIAGGIICVLLLFVLTGVLAPVGRFVRTLTLPLVRISALSAQRVRTILGRSSASEMQLKGLEARIATVVVDMARLQSLEDENRTLRAQLHFLQTSGYTAIGAQVIGRDLQNGRMQFLLDRGTRDQVETGQAVITNEGVFVGKILTTAEHVSVLEVFTDPDARTATSPAQRQRLVGIVEGRGNGAALLTYIPPSELLKKEDLLVTAGTEEKVPANLPLGIINRVNGLPTDPFLTAAVEPLVGLDRLAIVSILRPTVLKTAP
jgi:rod shape-determining protein MreC